MDGVSDDSNLLVDAMRHLADQQVARAERVRTSARQTFAYLTAIFTVAQAGTLAAFARDRAPSHHLAPWLLGLAIATVVVLGIAGVLAVKAEQLKKAPEIGPADITKAGDDAIESGEPLGEELTLLYAQRIEAQGAVIDERREPLKYLSWAAIGAIVLLVCELIVALVGRFA